VCVVTLPRAEGDIVSCGLNAELEFGPDGGITSFVATELHPEGFQLLLTRDGERVFEEYFTPTYEVSQPSGVGCGKRLAASFVVDGP
jgi:hypothetical protein